jgi:hypothetical protein
MKISLGSGNHHRRYVKYNRPPQQLAEAELDTVEEMSRIHCEEVEIAHFLDFSLSLFQECKKLDEEIQHRIDRGRAKGKQQLRQVQVDTALKGNTTMLVWLGKHILKQNVDASTDLRLPGVVHISEEQKTELLRLTEHIYNREDSREIEAETQMIPNNETPSFQKEIGD